MPQWLSLLFLFTTLYFFPNRTNGLASTIKNVSPLRQLTTSQKFEKASSNDAVIFIDVENVRGKSGFGLSHADVIHSTAIWAKHYKLENRVSLLVDHGSVPAGYYFKDRGLSIIFAGRKLKADDVIVRDIPFCQDKLKRDVVIITQDYELTQRCKRAAHRSGGKEMSIIPPLFFLTDLQNVVGENLLHDIESRKEDKDDLSNQGDNSLLESTVDDKVTDDVELEITLGAKLIAVESQLRNKANTRKSNKYISTKKRKKLEKQAEKLRTKLGLVGNSTFKRATSIIANEDANEDGLSFEQQNALLNKWRTLRKASKRPEQTGDRVLLAEALRRELETITGSHTAHVNFDDIDSMNPSQAHANYANSLIHGKSNPKNEDDMDEIIPESLSVDESLTKKDTLRLVIISDTHGFERQLTSENFEPWLFIKNDYENKPLLPADNNNGDRKLPEGDILLHLGDFAIDRGGVARRKAIDRFDAWLSHQPFRMKFVVRGNHDPYTASFPLSKATYITKPTTLHIGSKVLAFVPFGNGGFASSKLKSSNSDLLPATCDILATHEPPHNILDKCLSGERAGSSTIRLSVQNMKALPPKLWVCGHIHEGRGSIRTTFGNNKQTNRETVVINASNANPGRAQHLEYGPVVVDLSDEHGVFDGGRDKRIEKSKALLKRLEKDENVQEMLLAVDLGLKSGASLFDDTGRLLKYAQINFKDAQDLYELAPKVIDSWQKDVNNKLSQDDSSDQPSPKKQKIISYLAVEGGGELYDAWEMCLENELMKNIQLVSVRPEEWRANLLLPKERQSSRTCKEAARLLARQVVADFGDMKQHEGRFTTDAAESVAMGYHMANVLGWINRKPIVNRYSNGKIIVPK